MKTAAAYARYSTDKQTGNSIAYQLDKIRVYCAEKQIQITATYTDEGQSGTNTDRPGFRALLAGAQQHAFDAVVIYDITRGSRDVGDWFTFRKRMALLGIEVISATQPLGDITDGNTFLLELISVGMGEHEVLANRQKSIDGVAIKAREGVFLGGVPPLGYDVVDGKYVINQHEAAIVQKIFAMYAAGESYNAILDTLKGQIGKRGRPIGKNSLYSILRNERYVGVYTWNKRQVKLMRQWAGGRPNPKCVRIEGIIPRIIDDTTWRTVQKRMDGRKHNGKNSARRTYLLSGLIECELCGSTYTGHTTTNSKGCKTAYYCCGNKYRTGTCKPKNINANMLESFVVAAVKSYLSEQDYAETAKKIADQVNGATEDLSAERKELADVERQLANGLKAILSGFSLEELTDEMDRLKMRRSELQEIIVRKSSARPRVDPLDIETMLRQDADRLASGLDEKELAALIRQYVQKIYAHADGSCTVNVGVLINGCGDTQHKMSKTYCFKLVA